MAPSTPLSSRSLATSLSSRSRPSAAPRPLSGRRGRPRTRAGPAVAGRGSSSTCARRCPGAEVGGVGDGGRHLLSPGPAAAEGQGCPPRPGQPGAGEGVEDDDFAAAFPVGAGGLEDVGLDRGGQHRPGPLQDGRDDHPGGLEAARGPDDQHRMAVLGGQQPPEGAAGAAQDHPAGLGLADPQRAKLPGGGPGGRPGRWPLDPGTVRIRVAQSNALPQPYCSAGRPRRAGGRGDEAGIHPSWAGQHLLDGGGPGQRRVVQVVAQLQHDAGDLGRVQLKPGMTESQASELTGRPDQPARRRAHAQGGGQQLMARGQGVGHGRWPLQVRPHPDHPPTRPRRPGAVAAARPRGVAGTRPDGPRSGDEPRPGEPGRPGAPRLGSSWASRARSRRLRCRSTERIRPSSSGSWRRRR
jgi:hypothetical protein